MICIERLKKKRIYKKRPWIYEISVKMSFKKLNKLGENTFQSLLDSLYDKHETEKILWL